MTDQEMFNGVDKMQETALAVHRLSGPGHFEKEYEHALANRRVKAGIGFVSLAYFVVLENQLLESP